MERLNEYLRNLSIERLMNLSRETEGLTFEENSLVRKLLISEYGISSDFHIGLVGLRSMILTEITRRHYDFL
jgi:hypothetical protein